MGPNPAKPKPISESSAINPSKFSNWHKDTWKTTIGNIQTTQLLRRSADVHNTMKNGPKTAV